LIAGRISGRKLVEGTAGWVFGLALSVLLISVWGRAVVSDSEALGEALSPLAGSSAIAGQFADWMGEEMATSGVTETEADQLVTAMLDDSVVDDALDRLVAAVVEAAATPGVAGASVDVAEAVSPAIPEVTAQLASSGVHVSENDVRRSLDRLGPLVIREPGIAPAIGPESPVAARLGAASVLALIVMSLAAWAYARSKGDRIAAVRSLLTRIALSAVSFGLMLRLGSWVLDPSGGRAPVTEAIAGVAGAKWTTPVVIGLVAAAAAAGIWLARRRVRRVAVSPEPIGEPIPR
jgi:hypothetical protein